MRSAMRLLATLSLAVLISHAQTAVSWNGGNGNWSTATDWSGGVVPNNGGGNTYNVTIRNGSAETVTLDLGVTISDLTLGTNAILQSSGNNSLTIAGGGTFSNNGTLEFNTGGNVLTIQSGGTLNNSGLIFVSGMAAGLNVTGATTNNAGAVIELGKGSISTLMGNVANSGTFETFGKSKVTVAGTFDNNAGAGLQLNPGAVVKIGALNNSGGIGVDRGASLVITGGGSGVTDVVAGSSYKINGKFVVGTTDAFAKLTNIEGGLYLGTGQHTITPMGATLTIAKGGNFTADAPNINVNGNINNSGVFVAGLTGLFGPATVNVSGTFTNNSGAKLGFSWFYAVLNVNALNNSGNLGVSRLTTLNITGGGSGVTDVAAGTQYAIEGNFNVVNGSITTDALANLTSIEGSLGFGGDPRDSKTESITPIGDTLTIAASGSLSVGVGSTLSLTGNASNSGSFGTSPSAGGVRPSANVSGTFTNSGFAAVGKGSTLTVGGSYNQSAGTTTVDGTADVRQQFTNSGQVVVSKGSTLTVGGSYNQSAGTTTVDGTADVRQQFTNSGQVVVSKGSTLTVGGSYNQSAGTTTVDGTADVRQQFTNSGQVVVSKGSTLTVGGSYNQSAGTATVDGTLVGGGTPGVNVTGGTIQGAGTLNANVSVGGGTINVGDSGKAGLLKITGTYAQLSTGTMNVSIGGTTVGTKFSQLQVSGAASLGGTLTAALVNGFTPTVGQTFAILKASSVTGTFANSTIAINSSEHFNVSYRATSVVLTVASGPVSRSANTALVSQMVAANTKQAMASAKPIVLSSRLRYKIGQGAKPVFVAGLRRADGHSNAIIERAWERNSIDASHAAPIFSSWNRIPEKLTQAARAIRVSSMRRTSAASRNWGGMTQNVRVRPTLAGLLATATNRSAMAPRMLPVRMPMIRSGR
jgi:hypothetical protein